MVKCLNCTYHKFEGLGDDPHGEYVCTHNESPSVYKIDYVTGERELIRHYSLCNDLRKNEKYCGKDGKWFDSGAAHKQKRSRTIVI